MLSAFLGLDLGTTSVSVVAIDASRTPLAAVTVPHQASVADLPAGQAEQDPVILWHAVCRALNQICVAVPNHAIVAVGLTGQMHSTLLLDAAGVPCGNIITWQDQRAVVGVRDQRPLLEQLLSKVDAADMRATGCQLSAGYMGTTIYALQQLQQWPKQVTSVAFVADWIAARLCQQSPVTDRSHAASSGLYDLQHDCWSNALLAATQTEQRWLPEVLESGLPIGRVSGAVAQETGLPVGTQVCNAIGDHPAAVLSSLPRNGGSLLINIGTGGQIAWRVPAFRRVDGMDTRYLPSLERPASHEYLLVGAGLCGGDSVAWINRTIGQWLQSFGVHRSAAEIWQVLAQQLAALPPDTPPLLCEPFFQGTRPDPGRRGILRQIGATNFTPSNVARSILNGIAQSMFEMYQSAAPDHPAPLTDLVMSGNGSRHHPLLVEAVAKRFGVPATVATCQEEAATGAAWLASSRIDC